MRSVGGCKECRGSDAEGVWVRKSDAGHFCQESIDFIFEFFNLLRRPLETENFGKVFGAGYQCSFSASYGPESLIHVSAHPLFRGKILVMLVEEIIQLILDGIA